MKLLILIPVFPSVRVLGAGRRLPAAVPVFLLASPSVAAGQPAEPARHRAHALADDRGRGGGVPARRRAAVRLDAVTELAATRGREVPQQLEE